MFKVKYKYNQEEYKVYNAKVENLAKRGEKTYFLIYDDFYHIWKWVDASYYSLVEEEQDVKD